jgi:Flp pilus assembly protein TadG
VRLGAAASRDARGQSLVEFALIAPIFLALLLSVFDLGRVVWANDSLTNAAREAARFAIVHGGSKSTACPVGPAPAGLTIPAASVSCPFPSPSKQAIRNVALQHAVAGGSGITVTVCYGLNCAGDVDITGATNVRNTPVTVRVTGTVAMATGSFIGRPNYTSVGTATMHVSH